MNESKILRSACDVNWYAHAYSEYLADVAQTTSNLMSALQEVIMVETPSDEQINSILSTFGINPEARFILPEVGHASVFDIARNITLEINNEGDFNYPWTISPDGICSTIRSSWAQTVASSKAFLSFSKDFDNVVDQVNFFKQQIEGSFQVDDTVRDIYSMYSSMITASPNLTSFVKSYLANTGVEEASQSNDPDAYLQSDLAQYTGVTPGIALDFSTVNKVISSTVSIAANTIKGVFSVIGGAASWLFNKAKKYVTDTVIDPAVCEFVNGDADNRGYLDGFSWFGNFVPNVDHSHLPTGGLIASIFNGFYDEYATKWIKIQLKTGEFLFKLVSEQEWQCYFKPVAIDCEYLLNNFTGNQRMPQFNSNEYDESIGDVQAWVESVFEYVQPVSKDATKDQLLRGFAMATALTQAVIHAAFIESQWIILGAIYETPIGGKYHRGFEFNDWKDLTPFHESVTNVDIITAAAGDPSSNTNVENNIRYTDGVGVSINNTTTKYSIQTTMTDIICIWALARRERSENPIDYTFVPYSNNHSGFTAPSWRVKTDSAIAQTRDQFISRAIMAAVVVAAIVFVGAAAAKISKNLFFKRQQTLGTLDSKMWNGEALTKSERKKYIRYNRKQSACDILSQGSGDPSTSINNAIQNINKLIVGDN